MTPRAPGANGSAPSVALPSPRALPGSGGDPVAQDGAVRESRNGALGPWTLHETARAAFFRFQAACYRQPLDTIYVSVHN
jgi:hypothetical protein